MHLEFKTKKCIELEYTSSYTVSPRKVYAHRKFRTSLFCTTFGISQPFSIKIRRFNSTYSSRHWQNHVSSSRRFHFVFNDSGAQGHKTFLFMNGRGRGDRPARGSWSCLLLDLLTGHVRSFCLSWLLSHSNFPPFCPQAFFTRPACFSRCRYIEFRRI